MYRIICFSLLLLVSQPLFAQQQIGIPLSYCHIKDLSQEVLCGEYQVEENRQQPNGRTINIQIAILPAVSEAKEADPLVLFAGGPGQGSRAMARFVKAAFSEVNEIRDVVLIDQRGMGDSRPLSCDFPEPSLDDLDIQSMKNRQLELIRECAETLDADVTQYTQDIANEDIHEVLQALGYDKVNLYGASWGTRSALLYANQFPAHVRSVTVDGTAPLSNKVPLYFTRDAEKTINLLFQDCQKNEVCNTTFVDIEQRFRQFIQQFPKEGISTRIPDPNSGEYLEVTIGLEAVISAIRTILYSPDLSRMLPVTLERVMNNDFRPLAGILAGAGDAGMTIGATLTILCAEELARFSPAELEQQVQAGFEAATFASMIQDYCEIWPRAPLPSLYQQTLVQPMPTLILSGTLDPVTPPYWGDEMTQHFPNSLHLIAPNTGHNVAPVGCASDLIADFINSMDFEQLEASCLEDIKRPTFFLNSSGPVRRAE